MSRSVTVTNIGAAPSGATIPPPYHYQRLDAYQSRFAEIEEDFRAGRITPQERRTRMEQARDQSGITNAAPPTEYRVPKAAHMTELEYCNKRRNVDLRSRSRRQAA
ncbi:hypothetical protein [Azospirillum argentinense]|uniref:Uncharacterized protein n=1 Tax=Azospirillum brasilense TaxID=192 RepID=A0A4D8QDM2_AZOBR|nr:hypothetical protein [Azospirillum argentinense]QCO07361.1 hypothetical protein D3867_36395 [Azospirillum argentinense]